MNLSKEQLEKIKYCGIMQYDRDQTVKVLNPEIPAELYDELANPESIAGYIYNEGLNNGQFKLDAALFKLQSAEAELQSMKVRNQREVNALISDYLGENSEEEE
jgi:hypothetical protein